MMTVESEFKFKNKSGEDIYNITDTVKTVSTYGYQTANGIQYTLPNGTTLNDTVIFTDAKTCDLLSVPYENNGYGCELWVNERYLDDIPACCYYFFDLFCASAGNYTVYDKDKCAKMRSTPEAC
ncbi:male-specific histamine-binding salivary protein-like [Dermacentor silvarum]|uniref:male-specific histamine-binding salivary protein-like n=1 Tax=Dermacentor silvarum TaxID=543639 RepID=UPI0021018467|nr:male-specific histamine-binding salivary protein-like [Dermacentor silvarum]